MNEIMVRPIHNDSDHSAALQEIERLWNSEDGSLEAERLDLLMLMVEAYEAEHYPIPAPDPIDMIEFVMDQRGLSKSDLIPYLGSRAKVSEILNRRRPLSLEMIRKLHSGLGLPADILVQPYDCLLYTSTRYCQPQSIPAFPLQSMPTRSHRSRLPGIRLRVRCSTPLPMTKPLPAANCSQPIKPAPNMTPPSASHRIGNLRRQTHFPIWQTLPAS